jgi:hypothetical protein
MTRKVSSRKATVICVICVMGKERRCEEVQFEAIGMTQPTTE